jgi:hypothetical protein
MIPTTEKNMQNSAGRLVGLARAVALVVLAAATAAPAAAQIGGITKKLKTAAGAPETPAKDASAATAAQGGGVLVLDDEVLESFIKGLRAGQAEREAAAKADTPYGRYIRAQAAYAEAKPKCDAAMQTWAQRMAANQALMEKNNALLERMIAAMEKQDTALQRVYGDSMAALPDPSCAVKSPVQPNDWMNHQRDVDTRAEEQEIKVSGFTRQELGGVRDRVLAVLNGAPLPDMSPSEQDAVNQRADELNRLMGREVPAAAAAKPAPPPAAAAPPPQPTSGMSPEQEAMTNCMAKNSKKHEPEIVRLGESAAAAAQSGNTQAAMAIADSIRQLQVAGCPGT